LAEAVQAVVFNIFFRAKSYDFSTSTSTTGPDNRSRSVAQLRPRIVQYRFMTSLYVRPQPDALLKDIRPSPAIGERTTAVALVQRAQRAKGFDLVPKL